MNIFFQKTEDGIEQYFSHLSFLSQRPYSELRKKKVAFMGLHWLTGGGGVIGDERFFQGWHDIKGFDIGSVGEGVGELEVAYRGRVY